MATPSCVCVFNPVIPEIPFQVSLITDSLPPVSKVILPPDFTPDETFLAFETSTLSDVTTHSVTFLNETPETKILRLRNISDTPGVWSDTVINNVQVAIENTVPFAVEIIPTHTNFTMDLRWQLENSHGDLYGPYIGVLDNIKNVPPGDYILRILDLEDNIISEEQISTDSVSVEVFIDVGYGTLTVNFNIPSGTSIEDFTYYTVSDFSDTSISNNYNSIKYDLETGLYYVVVLYRNIMLLKEDPDLDTSMQIDSNTDKTITITITDDLKIASVVEG